MSKRPLVYQKKNPPDFSVILCLLYTVQNVSVNNWETQRLFFFFPADESLRHASNQKQNYTWTAGWVLLYYSQRNKQSFSCR